MLQAVQIPLFSFSQYSNRKSLPDKIFSKRHTHRQSKKVQDKDKAKNIYKQIIRKRNLSLQVGQLQQSTVNKISGMPSIRKFRQERKKISQHLMSTVCKYNYQLVAEQRKKKLYLIKKNKYEKIKIIRQKHQKECMLNSRLKIMNEKQIKQSKKIVKQLIEKDRQSASLSVLNCQDRKKSIGKQIRQYSTKMKQKRKSQKQIILQTKRKMSQKVRTDEQRIRQQKKLNLQKCKTEGLKNYLTKLKAQIDSKKNIQDISQKTQQKLSQQTNKLSKQKLRFDSGIKFFKNLLKQTSFYKKKSNTFSQEKSFSTDMTKSALN